ncbi:MAG TPA: hypothetical protein VLJ86_07610 [Ramlibacter sp.]|nr:hypothetical protein [Ramlibacter sp.]
MTDRPATGIAPAEGRAFPLAVRLLATALVAATFYWGARASDAWLAAGATMPAIVLGGSALAVVLWCLAWMWRSRTRVDAEGVVQTWVWTKRVRWADVTQARLIGVPGLEWLITPRLVVRPRGGGVVIFHSADRAVIAAFAGFVTLGAKPDALAD